MERLVFLQLIQYKNVTYHIILQSHSDRAEIKASGGLHRTDLGTGRGALRTSRDESDRHAVFAPGDFCATGANIPCVVWRSRESQILHSKENGVVHIKKCRKNHP